MTDTPSLSFARQCVEHLIAIHSGDVGERIIDGAKYLCIVAAYLEKKDQLFKAMKELDERAPEIAALLKQIPEIRIDDVRFTTGENDYVE